MQAHDAAVIALTAWRDGDRRTLAPLRMAVTFAAEYERLLTDDDTLDNLDERDRLTLQTAGRGFAARLRRLLAQREVELLDQAAEQLLDGDDLDDVLELLDGLAPDD